MTSTSLATLPVEILHHIFSFCDTQTILFSIRSVCKYFYYLINTYDRFTLTLCPEIVSNFKLMCNLIRPENIATIKILGGCYRCNHMVLFHSACDIRQCTRIRSVTLVSITDEDVIQFLKLMNTNVLTSLSITPYQKSNKKILEYIPCAIEKCQIQKLFLNNFDYAIKQTLWPVNCTLTHLEIGRCSYEEYIMILQHLSRLRTLSMKECIMNDSNTMTTTVSASNSNITFKSSLTSLTIIECKLSTRELELLVSVIPSLQSLRLTDVNNRRFDRMIDGSFWKELIITHLSLLKKFEIYFRTTMDHINDFGEFIIPFRTSFWTTEKCWIVACSFDLIRNYDVLLYTIPIEINTHHDRAEIRCEISSQDGICRLTKRSLNQMFTTTPDETLIEVHCYYGFITDKHMRYLFDGLRNSTTVTKLFISSDKIGNKGLKYLANVFQHNTIISEVYLRSTPIDEQGAELLSNVLQTNQTITILELGRNELEIRQAYHLGIGLANNTTLTRLILHNNRLRDDGMEYIGNALKTNNTLLLLNLKYNGMGEKGTKYLAAGLKENKKLAILELEWNGIREAGARYLADALQHNTTLMRLGLEENYILDDGLECIINALHNNTTMTVLSLEANGIKDKGAKVLADFLKTNSTLKKLYLYQNRITLDGIKHLADALQTNTTLTTFGIGWNLTGFDRYMADVIRHNKTLVELDLHYNDIEDEGAIYIADALRHNTTLSLLDVSSAGIKQKGFKHLADALAVNKSLTAIDFCFSVMAITDAQYIAKAIENNTTLSEVRLFDKETWNKKGWHLKKLHQQDKRLRYERNEGYRRLISPSYLSTLELELIVGSTSINSEKNN